MGAKLPEPAAAQPPPKEEKPAPQKPTPTANPQVSTRECRQAVIFLCMVDTRLL